MEKGRGSGPLAPFNQIGGAGGWELLLPRAVALLLTLGAIKLILIAGLGRHILQEHWRLAMPAPAWPDFAALWVFIVLVVSMLVQLGRALRDSGLSTLRWFNAGVCLTALLHAFFNFQQLGHNYLLPLWDGVLGWRDIWQYLKLDLFFRRPYLSFYLGGYALVYWILWRTVRERWSLFFLAGVVGLYLVLEQRKPLDCGPELLAIDCVGLAALIGQRLSRAPLNWKYWAVLLVPGLAGWAWFAMNAGLFWRPGFCLPLIAGVSLGLAGTAYALARPSRAFHTLSWWLPFCLVAFFLLSNRYYRGAANFDRAVVYGLAFPHYFWQETIVVAALLMICLLFVRKSPWLACALFDLIALAFVVLGLVDLRLSQTMGIRLDWSALAFLQTDLVLLWRTVQPQAGALAWGLGLALAAYAGLVWGGRRWFGAGLAFLSRPRSISLFCIPLVLLASLLAVGSWMVPRDNAEGLWVTRVVTTSPWWASLKVRKLTREQLAWARHNLGLAETNQPAAIPPQAAEHGPEMNLFLVVLESAYNRYLSMFGAADETQPLLKKYRARMELFPNFYANFPSSLNARFSVMSGLYPCKPHVTYVNPQLEALSLFDLLHDQGYVVSLFDSCYQDYERWHDYWKTRRIDLAFDADTMPGREKFPKVSWGVSEQATMEAIKQQFAQHAAKGEKFFLSYLPVMPHMPFDAPSQEFRKFNEGGGALVGDYTGRYKNQLLYMDWVLTSLLDELTRLNLLEKTLVVITDDHGEMVGEDGSLLGHGWYVEPWLSNIPLIIMNPKSGRQGSLNPVLGSQVDLLPTVLDLLRIPLPPGELYEGLSLYSPQARQERKVYINSYGQRAIIQGDRYFLEDRNLGHGSKGRQSARTYQITQQGAKTSYRLLEQTAAITAELDRFEQVQKSLLVHYDYARRLVQPK